MAGPGSDWSEESALGIEPTALDFVDAPWLSSRARAYLVIRVAQELACRFDSAIR